LKKHYLKFLIKQHSLVEISKFSLYIKQHLTF